MLAAILGVGLLPAAAPARAEGPVFTVTADRGASARFHLDTDTTLSLGDARIVTAADYAGIAFYTDDGRLTSGLLTVPAMSAGGVDVDPVRMGARDETVLRRGWYRVVVLADARTEVHVPVLEGSGTTIAAKTPHRQSFRVLTTTVRSDLSGTAELRAPLPASTRTDRTALLARLSPAVVAGKFSLVVCAAARARACGTRDTKVTMSGGQGSAVNAARMIQAGLSTSGRGMTRPHDAVARVSLRPLTEVPFSFAYVHWSDLARG